MRSHWMKADSISQYHQYNWCPYKWRKLRHGDTGERPREDRGWDWGDCISGAHQGAPRMAGNDRKLGGGQEGLSPAAFRENAALPAARFQTSGCQNRDRTNFYACKPSSLLHFIVQPKETIAMYLVLQIWFWNHVNILLIIKQKCFKL